VSCDRPDKAVAETKDVNTLITEPVDAEEAHQLMEKHRCTTCHRLDKHSMGPAYLAIAQKYLPTTANLKHLMSQVANGSSGIYGKASMKAHPSVPKEHLDKMVRFILSLHIHPQDMMPILASPDNKISGMEKAQGWQLLFDGQSLSGWRNFKRNTIGKSWTIDDHAIHLKAEKSDEGQWQTADGGDIITQKTYSDFILKLDWKANECANSGIMFNVVENDSYDYVWQTGPEMQILDNRCHPEGKVPTHRAGDLFDMIESRPDNVLPAGEWNRVVIKNVGGWVEFWVNDVRVVEFSMFDETWKKRIANSKFKDMPGFGMSKSGHISLQDHGDKVWFKNIKIKETHLP
jgi:cytochrome c551/c552